MSCSPYTAWVEERIKVCIGDPSNQIGETFRHDHLSNFSSNFPQSNLYQLSYNHYIVSPTRHHGYYPALPDLIPKDKYPKVLEDMDLWHFELRRIPERVSMFDYALQYLSRDIEALYGLEDWLENINNHQRKDLRSRQLEESKHNQPLIN